MRILEETAKDGVSKVTKIILSPNIWIKQFESSGDVILHILFKGKRRKE